MTQLTLFPIDSPPRKLARESDPETSHEAARKTDTSRDRSRVLHVFRQAWPNGLTAKEAATRCARQHGEENDHTRIETYRKRAGELKQIEDTGTRRNGGRVFCFRRQS